MCSVRTRLASVYQNEFLPSLVTQATNRKDLYRPVKHHKLDVGDIVLLKDPFQKCYKYSMGRVSEITSNHLGEVTDAVIIKGNGGTVNRHVTSLIPLLCNNSILPSAAASNPVAENYKQQRPRRATAIRSKAATQAMYNLNSV